ncbi:uncharacterized protein LOC112047188 [Bicyclus anynana]|uniref:Uncharacterized protein LOC112047188 n=1 Tax=Bicyclus anynana TaxID=110368 RepID=A0A6J1MWG9_BICAN|nr:uncharacterized protein LOC112047188 [Bicyclus anynana]
MSEANDINSDNLCTTEDAFEKFQAVSVCEEEVEYITLSDIVSPPPPNHDPSDILPELLADDVSPPLVPEEPVNQVTSTTDQNVQEILPSPKKRGRKKKANMESSSCPVSGQTEYYDSATVIDNESIKNNITSLGLENSFDNSTTNKEQVLPEALINSIPNETPRISRRGRYIRKPVIKEPIQQKIPNKRGRKPKHLQVPAPSLEDEKNVTQYSNNDNTSLEQPKLETVKRGRRKKRIPSECIEFSNEVIIENETNLDLVPPVEETSLPNVKRKKRGKKIKKYDLNDTSTIEKEQKSDEVEQLTCYNPELFANELTEDEIEDMPLVALSNKIGNDRKTATSDIPLGTENELLIEMTKASEIKDNVGVQKTQKKRGRPKKVHTNDFTLNQSPESEKDIITTNSIGKHINIQEQETNDSKMCIDELSANNNTFDNNAKDEATTFQESQEDILNDSPNKRNSKKPIMSDFEYNIDSIIKNDNESDNVASRLKDPSEPETEDSSKRPVRRKVKKNLHYDEGSDEDPYANIELSDDEPRRRKGGKYYSDDEYIPGGKRQLSDASDSDIDIDEDVDVNELLGESIKHRGRKYKGSESGSSPRKRAKKGDKSKPNNLDVFTQKPTTESTDDLEDLLETSVIKTSDDTPKSWGSTKEFNDFLIKISQAPDIKIKKAKSMDTSKAPLQIPIIDQNEVKKTYEMCAQTDTITTKSVLVQTTSVHELPMKNQVQLTSEQSEKACEFLSGIVRTTAELGQLMIQKSENFIEKKINTTHVTDTLKMDFCVQKSFLLFRLAKHNLVQMEEDLAKQYTEFLKENNLIQHREELKVIEPTSKAANSDSDCEIVEEPLENNKEVKQAFNPKTVFLNKELSIKIAKKSCEEPKPKEKVNVKGRHTVWINDSIMVKKVKPTQSFLAQDSRNKKPPDTYITLKMVSDFFKIYNQQKAISTCAQLLRPQWLNVKQNYFCYYFFHKTCETSESSVTNEELTANVTVTENLQNMNDLKPLNIHPKSLLTLCTKAIQKLMLVEDNDTAKKCFLSPNIKTSSLNSDILLSICEDEMKDIKCLSDLNGKKVNVGHLKTLCYKKLVELICMPDFSESNVEKVLTYKCKKNNSIYKINEDTREEKCSAFIEKKKPLLDTPKFIEKVEPLFTLCLRIIQDSQKAHETPIFVNKRRFFEPHSLKSIVLNKVKNVIQKQIGLSDNHANKTDIFQDCVTTEPIQINNFNFDIKEPSSLNFLCIDVLNNHILYRLNSSFPNSLKSLCINHVNNILNKEDKNDGQFTIESHIGDLNFTINNVNTVSEEVFLNVTDEDYNEDNQMETFDGENNFSDDCEADYENDAEDDNNVTDDDNNVPEDDNNVPEDDNNVPEDDNNWVSQVQMKELRSFIEPINNTDSEKAPQVSDLLPKSTVNIKAEPLDEQPDNIAETNVKMEPLDEEDSSFLPLIETKQEHIEAMSSSKEPIQRQNSNSYDENTFETFVSSNKMITSMTNYEFSHDEVFTQSTSRVRRQYEPDSDDEIENLADSLNLLVPQNIEKAKDRLMESSSDEDTNKKTKPEKRARGRPKKNAKTNNPQPVVKENVASKSELAILTRRMKEKIRQVEKKNKSSESESEDTPLNVIKETSDPQSAKENLTSKSELAILTRRMKDKIKQVEKKNKTSGSESEDTSSNIIKEKEKSRGKSSKKQPSDCKEPDKEIQCSDVDSTEQINEFDTKLNEITPTKDKQISEKDTNEKAAVSCDKELNNFNDEENNVSDMDDRSNSPLINTEDPVELLECEPNIAMLMERPPIKKKLKKKDFSKPGPRCSKKDYVPYIDRHGWNCYPINTNDSKIYQDAQILLHKLPESFVQTYLKYQDLSEQSKDDSEVDKLTNLQSLHRVTSKEKGRQKTKDNKNITSEHGKTKSSETDTNFQTDVKVEPCEELLPSEDEDDNTGYITPPDTIQRSAENCLAKDFLMNEDNDSDSEKPEGASKKQAIKNDDEETAIKKSKRSSKSKTDDAQVKPSEELMLTADKVMNKELALLHAPVELDSELPEIKFATRSATKNPNKTSPKTHTVRENKDKDDSSSEEEKQWFTTKEKLLKRLEKKQECPSVDDAKRAKIINEFIEKRVEGPQIRLRARPIRKPRSSKKMMERRKQMKILTRELLGDDASHTGKKSYQTYGKGRRNIRKVINRKALSLSTVTANMEESQRKQRLAMRQTQLREILGCEEGVNVVVINDELCLEYDFDTLQPVVTVHPFFTKVMKAHQYEGVKFMWDACFESVEQVQSGHPGGGCILAHCMGLGKTLQVLALLHTVLTNPQVGMQRVLVCCPLSTVLNWVDEIHKWIGPVTGKIKVFELSKLKKTYERAYQLEDWYNGGGIFIIGYELFRSLSTLDPVLDCVRVTILNKIRSALLDPGPDIVICDEGHLLKNDCSVLAVAMSRVRTRRRIILTGTPMQNNLREYYCMVNFVKPCLLGSYSEYSNRFENPIMNGQHRDSIEEDIKLMKARTHILHKVLEGCLQRQEASVLYPYLPKKHEYTVFVSLTKSQREMYMHYLKNYAKETKQSVLKDFHVLQKIWTHPQVLHNFFMKSQDDEKEQKIKVEKEDDLVAEDLGASEDTKPSTMETWWLPYVSESDVLDELNSSNKFLVIFRLLEECIALGDKVLIFSTSLYTMDALEYFLRRMNHWSLGREYYRLDGSVPAEVRQKWCREFNADTNTGTKLFLISTRAGCLGLNMTAANRVIILDTSWNPAHDIQSIFRVYRFGQRKDCYIYRLVAMGTMEQKIYERSVTKQAVACRVVDEQQIDRHYNMSELTELYRLDEDGTGVAAGLAAGVRDAALLRVADYDTSTGPLLYAVHEHDSLLRGSGESGLAEDERAAVWSQFQEEHANKHIQNIALKLPKNPKVNGENAKQDPNNQTAPNAPDAKPKSKRGRKPLASKNPPPAQPSTSSQDNRVLDQEESMIQKIMQILIQHNFHTNGPEEIGELIKNVRKTVSNPKRMSFRHIDPMTASIAQVLLEEDAMAAAPKLTVENSDQSQYVEPAESTETIVGTLADYNTICFDQNEGQELLMEQPLKRRRRKRNEADSNSIQDQNELADTDSTEMIVGTPVENSIFFDDSTEVQEVEDIPLKKRRRQRRESDEEYVPDKQKIKKLTDKLKPKTRKSNEYNPNSNSENAEEMIISDLPSTENTTPIIAEEEVPQQTVATNRKASGKKEKDKVKKKNQPELEVISDKVQEPENVSESILLSDDDEPVTAPAKAPDVIPQSNIKLEKPQSVMVKQEPKQSKEPPIPLHKSLLTNKNFIKIVAHTYLTGNPMLDEDAAVLAAQYSTLKALKELEATNKDIVSGPIYDIAVQVLGRDLLKKLHNASSTKKDDDIQTTSSPITAHTDTSDVNKPVDDAPVEVKNKPGPRGKSLGVKRESTKKEKHTKTSTITIDDDFPAPSTSTAPAPRRRPGPRTAVSAPEVVPVGLFQGPSTLLPRFPSQDECILPDDDDAIIVGDAPTIVEHTTSKRDTRNRISGEQTVVQPKVVQIVQKQPVVNPIPLPPPPAASPAPTPQKQVGSGNETICLDSDEEEPVQPVVQKVRKAVKSTTKLPYSDNVTTSTDSVCHVTPVTKSDLNTILDKKKKILLVPTSEFKSMQSKNAPISSKSVFQQGSTTSQTASISKEPISTTRQTNYKDVGKTTDQLKSQCLPGDIIRISKAGKVEILRKTEQSTSLVDPSADNSFTIIPEELINIDNNAKNDAKTPLKTVKSAAYTNYKTPVSKSKTITIPKSSIQGIRLKLNPPENTPKVTASESAPKSYSKSSTVLSSIVSRSKSPDPLSVLQNVVQIPADKYQATMATHSADSRSLQKPTDSNKINEKYKVIATPTKTTVNNSVKRDSVLLRPSEVTKPEARSANSKVIDLTEALTMVSEIQKKASPKTVVSNVKVSGSSKDISISKAGKLMTSNKIKPSTSFDTSTKPNTSLKKPAATEVSKRPSPWQDTLPYKKKKPDGHRLTLADFDIDDLDDIIELE